MILGKTNCTDCIPYLRDLKLEIDTLEHLSKTTNKNLTQINEQILEKKETMLKCVNNLEKLSSYNIETRIYLYMLSGMSVSKAISKVADENMMNNRKPADTSTIWKYYYPKLKKILNV